MLHTHEINPYIRVAVRSVLNTGLEIKRRIIFDYEFIYIADGSMTFFYNDIPYKVSRGHFLFIRPGIPHSFQDIQALHQPHIHFDFVYHKNSKGTPVSFKDIPALSPQEKALISEDYFHNAPPFPFITFHDTEKALSLFYRTIDANTSKDSLAAKGYLTALLAMIIDDNFPDMIKKDIGNYTIANQIRDIIDSQQGLRHSLDDLESQLSYSKFYLERQFKNEYGISIIAYQNEKKFIEATRMLATKSISQVAAELGYSSIYSFSRAFKNKYGLSPSQYRQNTGK